MVTAFFKPHVSYDESSWTEIKADLRELLSECREQSKILARRSVGTSHGIELYLFELPPGPELARR